MTNRPVLTLDPVDLTDKWGFGDGDIMDNHLYEWMQRSAWAEHLGQFPELTHSVYFDHRLLLIETVNTHLVPALPPEFRSGVHRTHTVHNNMRIYVDTAGQSISDEQYEIVYDAITERLRHLAGIDITCQDIDRICGELFPFRDKGWIAFYEALFWPSIRAKIVPSCGDPREEYDVHYQLMPYVDKVAAEYDDDEMFLAADLIVNNGSSDLEGIQAALRSARLVLK